jgi:hypothetical protein
MEVTMAKRKLTTEEMAAKVAKMKATKAANKAKALAAVGYVPSKPKKIRKKRIMTEEQKQAARDRLAKARENRGPSTNKLIAESVRNLPDEDKLSLKNVRPWLKENKELLASMRSFKDSKDSKERGSYQRVETYVSNIESYLRNGVWVDLFYGPQQQNKIKQRVMLNGMAYYANGKPKRTVGVWYEDLAQEWTKEMELNDN